VNPRQKLAYQLKIQFSLPSDRPSDAELDDIIADLAKVEAWHGRAASKDEWRTATLARVRFEGDYFYKGLTFQDLNALLAQIRAQAQAHMAAKR
jgi:hypothetical protein